MIPKRAFVQFYKVKQRSPKVKERAFLQNGFSYVWNEADPIWVEIKEKIPMELPIEAETIYVSCLGKLDVWHVAQWASRNPKIKFVIGGPFVWPCPTRWPLPLPENMSIHSGFAEDIFNRRVDLKSWKLIPPKTKVPQIYSYHINDGCYWNKCRFCSTFEDSQRGYDLDPLWEAPDGGIFLATPTLRAEEADEILTNIPYKKKWYMCFVRGGDREASCLERVLPKVQSPDRLYFMIGVEFPSERMLKWMRKGVTRESLLRTIQAILGLGANVELFMISQWPNLVETDVSEAREFITKLRKLITKPIRINLSPLVLHQDSDVPIGKDIEFEEDILKNYYTVKMEGEQEKLNREWADMVFELEELEKTRVIELHHENEYYAKEGLRPGSEEE